MLRLVDGLPVFNACQKEAVALLLNIVVDDARDLLLPNLEPVDANVVLYNSIGVGQ